MGSGFSQKITRKQRLLESDAILFYRIRLQWAPASFGVTIIAYEADVRAGGTYRLEMGHASSDQTMTFYGRYLDVTPDARIVWTNDEGDEDGPVTTVTFEDRGGNTLVTVHDRYPSK